MIELTPRGEERWTIENEMARAQSLQAITAYRIEARTAVRWAISSRP